MPLPESFRNDEEFLEYVLLHSQTQRALFSIEQVEYVYELADEKSPFKYISLELFIALPYDEQTTKELLNKAFENVYEKEVSSKSDNNVVYLDDYR